MPLPPADAPQGGQPERFIPQGSPQTPEPSTPSAPSGPSGDERQSRQASPEPNQPPPGARGDLPSPGQAAAAPQVAPPGWTEHLTRRGADPSRFKTEDEFYDYVFQMSQGMEQMQRLAAFGQQVMPYAQQFDEWMRQQGQQGGQGVGQPAPAASASSPTPAAPPEEPYWPVAPEWNPEMEKFLGTDDYGNVVVRREYVGQVSPTLPQQYMAHAKYQRDRVQALARDPVEAIWKGIEKRLAERDKERGFLTRQDLDDYRSRQFANSFAVANQDWMYARDPTGNFAQDGRGGRLLSEPGQVFVYQIQRLESLGITDPQQQAQMAMELTAAVYPQAFNQGRVAPSPQSPAPQPQQPTPQVQAPADPRERFLQGNGHSPNRSGSLGTSALPSVPQNSDVSFSALLRQRARERGVVQQNE